MLKEKKTLLGIALHSYKGDTNLNKVWKQSGVFFLYDQSDINFVKGNDIFVCSQFVRSH